MLAAKLTTTLMEMVQNEQNLGQTKLFTYITKVTQQNVCIYLEDHHQLMPHKSR